MSKHPPPVIAFPGLEPPLLPPRATPVWLTLFPSANVSIIAVPDCAVICSSAAIIEIDRWTPCPIASGPPQRLANPLYDKPVQKLIGEIVILECPVMSETTVFFEWKRGEDPVEDLPRFKVFEETGVLKIKNAKITDSGTYVCNAVNGYGQIDVHVRLEVLTVEQMRQKNGIDQNKLPVDAIVTLPPPTPKPPAGPKNPIRQYKPYLVNTKLEEEVMKYEGENVTLPCKFEGRPTPEIRWYFKGEPLSTHMNKSLYSLSIATEGDFTEAKIMIPHVSENSTGRFTCQATNKKGSKSANIHLVVFPDTRPEIIGEHPLNSTFVEGQTITLYCRVRCTEEPSIQWIRKKEFASTPITGQAIKKKVKTEVVGSKHKPEVEFKGNNLYESILTIPDANISDAGIYVCTAMNVLHQSIAFREASVHVIHATERYEMNQYMAGRSRAAASRDPHIAAPPHLQYSRTLLDHPIVFWVIGLAIVLFSIILFTIVIRKTIADTVTPAESVKQVFIKSVPIDNQVANRIPLTPNFSSYSNRKFRYRNTNHQANLMTLNNTNNSGGCIRWIDEQNSRINTLRRSKSPSSTSSCQCYRCLRHQNKSKISSIGMNRNFFKAEKLSDPDEITVIN